MKSIKNIFHQTDNITSFIVGTVFIIIIGILFYSIFVSKQEKNEAVSTATQETQLPTKHIVQDNESLWTIAEKYYKSGYNWVDLAITNNLSNPDYVTVGQTLDIPNVKPLIVESGQISAASISAPKHTQITIQQGDTLWNIAETEYGSGYQWTEIVRINSITNPDLIYPGTVLRLQ